MGYSERCHDLQTYWRKDIRNGTCVPCNLSLIKPGFEFTPNCGYVDDGGRRDSHTKECDHNHFNEGRLGKCQRCKTCPLGRETRSCNASGDALCAPREDCGPDPTACMTGPPSLEKPHGPLSNTLWLAPLILLLTCVMLGAFYFLYKRKRRCFKAPQVHSAPLRLVLEDLDVLEELIVLLDPEGSGGVKCTRHLASYWSFPATWINYTYSMRDSRSPLKTLLEAVTARNPDWTVGHLARLLGEMGRTDAIMALAHLKVDVVRAF